MKPYYLLMLLAFIFGCGEEAPKEEEAITSAAKATQDIPYQKPMFSRREEHKGLTPAQVFTFVDNVYGTVRDDKTNPLRKTSIDKITSRSGVTSFDTSGVLSLYEYGGFGLLEYVNDEYANFAFRKIYGSIKQYRNNAAQVTDEGKAIDGDVLPKSGITYILADNYIYFETRQCDDNWKLKATQENVIIDKLFHSIPPKENFLIKYCCSCPADSRLELR